MSRLVGSKFQLKVNTLNGSRATTPRAIPIECWFDLEDPKNTIFYLPVTGNYGPR